MNRSLRLLIAIVMVLMYSSMPIIAAEAAEIVKMHRLSFAPMLDGDGREWESIPATEIKLRLSKPDASTAVTRLKMKGGVHEEHIYFYIEWNDATRDINHKPWVWDKKTEKYVTGEAREDRFALQFVMSGEYSTDWRSGNNFKADMWHWKASRSNPLGLAHDKLTIVSSEKLLRAWKITDHSGKDLYIVRPPDEGDKLYSTKRYRKYVQDEMPKYVLSEEVKGSVSDVQAKADWRDGKWHLELKRKLDTGHADDVVFPERGGVVDSGIAVFDRSENDDHAISDILQLQF